MLGVSVVTSDGQAYHADSGWMESVKGMLSGIDHHIDRVYSDPNTITSTPDERAALASRYNVAVDDEESWAVAKAAKQLGLPFIIVRAVSDQSDQTLLPDDSEAVNPNGTVNVGALIPDFFENPGEAILEAEGLQQALDSLRTAFALLGPTFGHPAIGVST